MKRCDTCDDPIYPDVFGNVFDTCSECVADRWVSEMVSNRHRKRSSIYTAKRPSGRDRAKGFLN